MTDQSVAFDNSCMQDRFTFSYKTLGQEICTSFNERSLYQTMDSFIDFLLGCGFRQDKIYELMLHLIEDRKMKRSKLTALRISGACSTFAPGENTGLTRQY
jgi:hypothetical protein